jgi:hypothetical protein
MRPIGYMYKRVSAAPAWLQAPQVEDIYSLSHCISEDFADYVEFWRHNGYWLFDSPAILRALAAEHSISLDGLKLFYYEAYELQYDEELARWMPFEPEASFVTDVQPPIAHTLEGFDVVAFSVNSTPECSPLSCNYLATRIATNSHCLLPSHEAAVQSLEAGLFNLSEPGPYRIIAVYSVDNA